MQSNVPVEQLLFDPKIERTAYRKLNENRKKKQKVERKESFVSTQQRTMDEVNNNNGNNNAGTPSQQCLRRLAHLTRTQRNI